MRTHTLFMGLVLGFLLTGCKGETDNDDDGVSVEAGDCVDADPSIYPGATEACDAVDSNCDGSIVDQFPDLDGDGTPDCIDDDDDADGTPDTADCEPMDASIHPGATDLPDDGVDQDCNGSDGTTCFVDLDGDGAGTTVQVAVDGDCTDVGEATIGGDCDDTNAAVHPGADEIIGNGLDDDCDDTESCFSDQDDDGFRTEDTVVSADLDCDDPGEALAYLPATDCNDAAADIHPNATEVPGDGVDQNCDGSEICFVDADDDGFRTEDTVVSTAVTCSGAGEALAVLPSTDCDDTAATVNPSAVEVAGDELDQDCDGTELCFVDQDNDGFRTATTTPSADLDCTDPGEATAAAPIGDCDDTESTTLPGGTESSCDDTVDEDCDGDADCDDSDCGADPVCGGESYGALLNQAYSASCCQWSGWGYASEAACLVDATATAADDCLVQASGALSAPLETCLVTATTTLADCMTAASTTCDDAAQQACWDAWSNDTDTCDSPGWYQTICPETESCDAGAVEYTLAQRCDGVAHCADGLDEAACFDCQDATLVPAEWECDGESDCTGGADEADCFTCDGGEVIPNAWICDTLTDCASGVDESSATCFTCEASGSQPAGPVPQEWVCDDEVDCPLGDDESTCNDFQCESGERVTWDWVCDGDSDCVDGSDEAAALCPVFTCGDGTDVPVSWICDGYEDCADQSDELGCTVFTCFDGTEVPGAFECDGLSDCSQGEDEVSCGLECESLYGGSTIPEPWVCDGVDDCVGGVDEACGTCDFGSSTYHLSRTCDGVVDCGNAMDERCVGADDWICSDLSTVIFSAWLCDGEVDCPGGEDESLCYDTTATCPGSPELHSTQVCDGLTNCTDGADEDPLVCGLTTLENAPPIAGSSDCEALAYGACNGLDECSGSSGSALDEVGCDVNVCSDGSKYPDAFVCDGHPDCPNAGDEANCPR
jgi:hypothetical protein